MGQSTRKNLHLERYISNLRCARNLLVLVTRDLSNFTNDITSIIACLGGCLSNFSLFFFLRIDRNLEFRAKKER